MAGQLSLEDLRTFLSRNASPEVEHSIQTVAKSVYGINCPLEIRWDLIRCKVDKSGVWEPDPYKVATEEHLESRREQKEWEQQDEAAYALAIRIQIPTNVYLANDSVTTMMEILTRDAGSFEGLFGIPFGRDPLYSMYHVHFTRRIENRDLLTFPVGDLWCHSTAAFLPVPSTVYRQDPTTGYMIPDRDSTLYKLHHWEEKRVDFRDERERQVMETFLPKPPFQLWAEEMIAVKREKKRSNEEMRTMKRR
ncbi:hypothetical protein F4821DRAFT_254221 [Hypoxylon rubiginosum]|uniref:Uncharacterized protein n=1 Tax=Hypoxylon rubiginosum TaxID=110542 RepID=A0ACC0DHU0_9PEZI|nr:hypothetical protein F4821DRAFT_254221 [Hypoxylon rubiginosum]